MAFEAFVASRKVERDRARWVGAAVSLGLHVPPLILLSLPLLVRTEVQDHGIAAPEADASNRVRVRIARFVASARPPAAAALPRSGPRTAVRAEAPRPGPVQALRQKRPPRAEGSLGEALAIRRPATTSLPDLDPGFHPADRATAPLPGEDVAGRASAGASSRPLAAPPGTGPDARSGPRPDSSEMTSGAASYLRTYETFPSLPDRSWSRGKKSYVFSLQVCVSGSGMVDDVVFSRGAGPDLDAFLASAIRTWRYRPWIVSGAPRPFCHPLLITYSRG